VTSLFEALQARIHTDGVEIDRAGGTPHPRFPDLVYPLDYGFIRGTTSSDGGGVDVFVGSLDQHKVTGALATFDEAKGDAEIKVLYDCTPAEIDTITAWLGRIVTVAPVTLP